MTNQAYAFARVCLLGKILNCVASTILPLRCTYVNNKKPLPVHSRKFDYDTGSGFLCLCYRVFALLLKSRFFVIYFRGITLADGNAFPGGAFGCNRWFYMVYLCQRKRGNLYEKDFVRLPWQDLSQVTDAKLYNAIPTFATGLPHLYYSHTTLQNNHILPQHDKII